MARGTGGANNMHPLSWGGGGTNGKDLKVIIVSYKHHIPVKRTSTSKTHE